MTQTRANWFLDVDLDAEEPEQAAAVQTVGVVLDLRDPEAIRTEVVALVQAEQSLYSFGVRCAIRDNADSCCSACPVRRHADEDAMTRLCDVGVEIERLNTNLAVIAWRDPPTETADG